jgi:hypothetical protein
MSHDLQLIMRHALISAGNFCDPVVVLMPYVLEMKHRTGLWPFMFHLLYRFSKLATSGYVILYYCHFLLWKYILKIACNCVPWLIYWKCNMYLNLTLCSLWKNLLWTAAFDHSGLKKTPVFINLKVQTILFIRIHYSAWLLQFKL